MRAKKLTHQQILNRAVLGVVRQGALSSRNGSCKYQAVVRGKVLRCGVGQLIEPNLYTPKMENAGANEASPAAWRGHARSEHLGLALIFSGVDVTDDATVHLLDELQAAHDAACDLPSFVSSARALADRQALQFPRVPASLSA